MTAKGVGREERLKLLTAGRAQQGGCEVQGLRRSRAGGLVLAGVLLVLGLLRAAPVLGLATCSPSFQDLPGACGARDTKVLVFNNARGPSGYQDDGTSDAMILWTHDRGQGTFRYEIYRHRRVDGRSFGKIGACDVTQSGTAITVAPVGSSLCSYDAKYNYVAFRDNGLNNYEEYYYLVADQSETPDAGSVLSYLNKFVIAAAFPPTQTRHGNFSEYTNACNACHGLHSSKHRKLLKAPTVTDLCGTCHDGTGSKYDEVRGRVRLGDSWARSAFAPAGPFGDRLKAGSGIITTSVHNVLRSADGQEINGSNALAGSARVWQAPGSGWLSELRAGDDVPLDLGVSNDWGSQLVCSSCHEPHNRAKNYRILRGVINDRTNILVRGVSEVDRNGSDATLDRGDWGGGDVNQPLLRRAMYTRFLSGGSSVLSYRDPAVEDRAFACADAGCATLAPDVWDIDHDGNTTEERALAYCQMANQTQALPSGYYATDPSSPTGVRCRVDRKLGGVTSFCTACHRAFMWPEAGIDRFGALLPGGATRSGYKDASMLYGDIPGGASSGRKVSGGRVEDNSGTLAYSGTWVPVLCAGCSGPAGSATETVSSQADAAVALTFDGNQVDVIASAGPDRGIVNVFVDGVWLDQVDLYAPVRADQQVIFSWLGASGMHTVKLVVTGDKNAASSGTAVGVDAFQVAPEAYTYSLLEDVPGEHKHPIGLPAVQAYREGKLVEGVLSSDGDVCTLRLALAGDPLCSRVGQGRLIDPVVPLEGIQTGKWQLQSGANLAGTGYPENAVVCLTCHVAHGSGAERIEVAYRNGDLNDTRVYTCTGYDGDGYCGNDPGEALSTVMDAQRDNVTGYLWNRLGDTARTEDSLTYLCVDRNGDGDCADPFERPAGQDGTPDGTFPSKLWDFAEPVFDATGKRLERWEQRPAYIPADQPYWTQLGFSSALARFNPMASVCYRCHSTTPNGALVP